MLRTILDARGLVALSVAICVGVYGLRTFPISTENPFLGLIALQAPDAFLVLSYGYATLWFTTPFFSVSLVLSVLAIATYHLLPTLG